MTLKKTYSAKIGYRSEKQDNGDGTYHFKSIPYVAIPQRDIYMHPLEEAETLSRWAIHDNVLSKMPSMPTKEDEHEWMIEHGPEYIKQKRTEAQSAIDALQPELEKHEKAWRDAEKEWNDHCEWCSKNGHDHDTYTGPK